VPKPPVKAQANPGKPPSKPKPAVVRPEPIDRAAYKINHLKNIVAAQAETIADLQAQNAELVAFVQANAELLELDIIVDGEMVANHGPEHAHEDPTEEITP
jgi:hypothetical protein